MLITEFAAKHKACQDGVDRALALGHTTMAEVWADERMNAADRIWAATRPGVLTDKRVAAVCRVVCSTGTASDDRPALDCRAGCGGEIRERRGN